MKIEELRQEIETKTTEVRGFLDKNDSENAKKTMEELRGLKDSLKIAEELEQEEKRDLENQKKDVETRKDDVKMGQVNEMRAITKFVLGRELNEEERSIVKTTDNQAILPKQFINEIELIEKGIGSLEEYCHIIPVTKNEGSKPIFKPNDDEFEVIAEGDNIGTTGVKTDDITYKCSKVGTITPFSNEIKDDSEIDIEYLAKEQFTVKEVTTKNVRICNVIKDACSTLIAGTSYKDINKVMDTALPAVKRGLKVFTNELGYSYLKNLEDKQGRNLNLVTELNEKYYFNGKELVVTDSAYLPNEEGKVDFYIFNNKEVLKMFKRKELTVAKSNEAGFNDDTFKIRILGRFDIKKGVVRNTSHVQIAI